MSREPENILALRLGGIGEVLAITPALRAVRERFSHARVTLLAERPASEVALGLVDEVVVANAPYRASGIASLLSPRLYAESARLVEKLLLRKWDIFLDFHHLCAWRHAIKPFLVGLLSRAPRRVGFGEGFFLTDRVSDPDDRHMTERNRGLLAPLGIELRDARPSLAVAPADQEWVDALLDALRLSRPVAISPGSSRPVTRWGIENFREVARRLSPIVLIGTAEERALCEQVSPTAANLAGKTTVGRLAALLKRCALLVSNDSGPLHMAYALGTPAVGIFRPLEYRRWGSYPDTRRFRALYREGPGAQEGETLRQIKPEEVIKVAQDLLGDTESRF